MSMTIICTLSPSINAHIYDHQTFICFIFSMAIAEHFLQRLSFGIFLARLQLQIVADTANRMKLKTAQAMKKKNKLVLPYVFCLSCKSCLIIGFSNIIIQMLRFYAFLFTRFCLTNIDLINMYQLLNVCRYYWKLTVLLLSLLL